MVYDNMKVAVTIRTGRKGRPAVKYPTKAMRQLSLYYRFGERFCKRPFGLGERIGGTPGGDCAACRLCVATVVRDP